MKHHAVMSIRPDKVAVICSWCDPDKRTSEAMELAGYETTHGICKKHQIELKKEIQKLKRPATVEVVDVNLIEQWCERNK